VCQVITLTLLLDPGGRVLQIADVRLWRDVAGDADAYGTIADCYTDLDMFEQAADYYDKYIQCMNKDGPV
jgi:hypothetical protein